MSETYTTVLCGRCNDYINIQTNITNEEKIQNCIIQILRVKSRIWFILGWNFQVYDRYA